MSVSIFC